MKLPLPANRVGWTPCQPGAIFAWPGRGGCDCHPSPGGGGTTQRLAHSGEQSGVAGRLVRAGANPVPTGVMPDRRGLLVPSRTPHRVDRAEIRTASDGGVDPAGRGRTPPRAPLPTPDSRCARTWFSGCLSRSSLSGWCGDTGPRACLGAIASWLRNEAFQRTPIPPPLKADEPALTSGAT